MAIAPATSNSGIWFLSNTTAKRTASLEELPSKHVDTGMGLERITAVLQNVLSNYDIDYMRELTATTEKLTGKHYGADAMADISFRVIDDHASAVSFLIADGVMPSNEGRGYVLTPTAQKSRPSWPADRTEGTVSARGGEHGRNSDGRCLS